MHIVIPAIFQQEFQRWSQEHSPRKYVRSNAGTKYATYFATDDDTFIEYGFEVYLITSLQHLIIYKCQLLSTFDTFFTLQ